MVQEHQFYYDTANYRYRNKESKYILNELIEVRKEKGQNVNNQVDIPTKCLYNAKDNPKERSLFISEQHLTLEARCLDPKIFNYDA